MAKHKTMLRSTRSACPLLRITTSLPPISATWHKRTTRPILSNWSPNSTNFSTTPLWISLGDSQAWSSALWPLPPSSKPPSGLNHSSSRSPSRPHIVTLSSRSRIVLVKNLPINNRLQISTMCELDWLRLYMSLQNQDAVVLVVLQQQLREPLPHEPKGLKNWQKRLILELQFKIDFIFCLCVP